MTYQIKILNAVNRYFGLQGKQKMTMKELQKIDSETMAQAAAMALSGGITEWQELSN